MEWLALVAVAVAGVAVTVAVRARAHLAAREALSPDPAGAAAPVGAPLPPEPDDGHDPALLRAALDATPFAVVVAAVDGQVRYRNRAAADLLTAHDHRVLVRDAVDQALRRASTDGSSEREVDLFGPPASTFRIRVDRLAGAGGAGGGRGMVAIVEDVSEGRRLERVRRDFVANVSHELKTPVGAVSLLADTLVGEAADDDADRDVVLRLAGRMAHEMGRLARTVEDLLELSRVESGDELGIEPVAVDELVRDAVERLAAAAESRDVSIEASTGTGVVVPGDRRQLTSAVSNLVDNAVKYSPEGSTVSVSVTPTETEVAVAVVDEGIGIPARDLARVFERFYRVDAGRSRETGGTGLGLSIVRHIAANHGGRVEVESREGSGSRFTLHLPRTEGVGADRSGHEEEP